MLMNTKMGAEIYISLTGLVWFKLCSNGYTKDNRLNHKVSTTDLECNNSYEFLQYNRLNESRLRRRSRYVTVQLLI